MPSKSVLDDEEDVRPFECDELSVYLQLPMMVVLPETIAQVQTILRLCKENELRTFGSPNLNSSAYDLLALITGSEGLLRLDGQGIWRSAT